IRLGVTGRSRVAGEILFGEDRHLTGAILRNRVRRRERRNLRRRRSDPGAILHALRLRAAILEVNHAPAQPAAVRREPGADRPGYGHVAVRIPIRTVDQDDAKQPDRNEEPPVAADPDELRSLEDRKELVVNAHDRKVGLDLLGAAGTGPDRLEA